MALTCVLPVVEGFDQPAGFALWFLWRPSGICRLGNPKQRTGILARLARILDCPARCRPASGRRPAALRPAPAQGFARWRASAAACFARAGSAHRAAWPQPRRRFEPECRPAVGFCHRRFRRETGGNVGLIAPRNSPSECIDLDHGPLGGQAPLLDGRPSSGAAPGVIVLDDPSDRGQDLFHRRFALRAAQLVASSRPPPL